jgi:superfamily II DNA/RNA helicase
MTFTDLNLHPKIMQAIETCGYKTPTQVQAKSIPEILSGKDVVASAQTGTGKTAAYVLPALQMLADTKPSRKPRVIILSPTRELTIQIAKVINDFTRFLHLRVVSIVGGVPYGKQLRELSNDFDILIATPGRLLDHMENGRIDLSEIKMLVLDEADRMLDMGFIKPIRDIAKLTPRNRQTVLFSATMDSKLMSLAKNLLQNPIRIDIAPVKADTQLITQEIHFMNDTSQKKKLLDTILDGENVHKAIIFSSTKRNAKKLKTQIDYAGHKVGEMHGDLKQNARNRILAQFRSGKIKFLVATDVASRGIDVADISHVINYDLPRFSEDYVHRIGRTGRAGKTGTAISLALNSEKQYLRNIEKYIKQKIPRARVA